MDKVKQLFGINQPNTSTLPAGNVSKQPLKEYVLTPSVTQVCDFFTHLAVQKLELAVLDRSNVVLLAHKLFCPLKQKI
jgi:hypothetical protein